jgi:hypothetical protein
MSQSDWIPVTSHLADDTNSRLLAGGKFSAEVRLAPNLLVSPGVSSDAGSQKRADDIAVKQTGK